VITRSRGADWVYTYLRSFYRDDSRTTGWNNLVFDKVGMPHVLQELQGHLAPVFHTEKAKKAKPSSHRPPATGQAWQTDPG
jgi:ubiquinol-cytochrome c reductase cytochrome c1 subunit